MAVAIDYSQRLYLVVSNHDGVVHLLERGSNGPDLLRRHLNEGEMIGVRHLPTEDFDKLFTIRPDISGGTLVKKWLEDHNWPVSVEARPIIERVIVLEDMIDFLRERAAYEQEQRTFTFKRRLK